MALFGKKDVTKPANLPGTAVVQAGQGGGQPPEAPPPGARVIPMPGHPPVPQLRTGLTRPARMAMLASLVLLGLVAFWATRTQISGAVIASGQAVVRGKPKALQSLDGGVVAEIRAANGDVVHAGDVLVRLDPTLLRINHDILRNRLAEALTRKARLEAENATAEEIDFARHAPALAGIDTRTLEAGQRQIFLARKELLEGRKEQYAERILQFGHQAEGIEGLIAAKRDQLGYIEKELANMRKLSESGLARESQVLELQRAQAGLLGELAGHQSELARTRNSVRDTEMEILQSERTFREEVVTELGQVTAAAEELVLQIATVEKQLARVDLTAPSDGIVHDLQIHTVGGVVPPATTILEIVPVADGLEFELRVDPRAIDQVHAGQAGRVRFPAFNSRTTPELKGHVTTVAPATVTDEKTGQNYYRIWMAIPPEEMARLGSAELVPGMPVEAYLETHERSVMSFLLKPMTDQLARAFRDD